VRSEQVVSVWQERGQWDGQPGVRQRISCASAPVVQVEKAMRNELVCQN
jgi:hypothetical protein